MRGEVNVRKAAEVAEVSAGQGHEVCRQVCGWHMEPNAERVQGLQNRSKRILRSVNDLRVRGGVIFARDPD